MKTDNKTEYLVVDTSAFIENVPLQEFGSTVITEQSVIDEITSKRQLRRLVVLPYHLIIKDVFPENIKFITEFAKKTGDYLSLSATDIKVIALTYQLEKEKVGKDHLKEVPFTVQTELAPRSELLDHPKSIAGFFLPRNYGEDSGASDDDENNENLKINHSNAIKKIIDKNKSLTEEDTIQIKSTEKFQFNSLLQKNCAVDDSEDYLSVHSDISKIDGIDFVEKFRNLDSNDDLKIENEIGDIKEIPTPVEQNVEVYDSENKDEDEDEEGWITPSNIGHAKKIMYGCVVSEKSAKVACMTTDFAMQNVLKQIGLNVAALDGRVIRQMRTFIFRCYACFKTTSVMSKIFCPNCGLKTLKKVAVSLDDEGNEKIHINYRKPLTARGKRFSLPTPKGGKHASNPILCEDQPIPDQRPTRLARTKNSPLEEDYIAGYSPFVMRDINSRSAMLGIRAGNHGNFKYWMKKNPNECKKRKK